MDSTKADESALSLVAALSALLGDVADELVLIGGVAVNFWRQPRYTHDVDFNARADPALMALISERLGDAGYRVTRSQASDAPSGPDFLQFKNTESAAPLIVEFQTAKTDFQELTIARGKRLSADQPFAVATPEDLIVLKLIANRPQDISDCIGLAGLPDLDWDYIDHWCGIWQVEERADGLRVAIDDERRRVEELMAEGPGDDKPKS